MTLPQAETREQLQPLVDYVRECPFSADDVVFDRLMAQVTVPFERGMIEESVAEKEGWLFVVWKYPIRSLILTIHDVDEMTVDDRCGIDRVDIGHIEHDPCKKLVIVRSSYPFALRLTVRRLRITLKDVNRILRYGAVRIRKGVLP